VIDWLTLKIDATRIPRSFADQVARDCNKILSLDANGVILWQMNARKPTTSDNHALSMRINSDLEISGSPARLLDTNNVFGVPSPAEAGTQMIDHVQRVFGVILPSTKHWRCTRVDITENYDLHSLPHVEQKLRVLRFAESPRFKVSYHKGGTVYWNAGSQTRSLKAYAKGPHLRKLAEKGKACVTEWQLEAANRLLRIEATLRTKYLKNRCDVPWYEMTAMDAMHEFTDMTKDIIGGGIERVESFAIDCSDAALSLGYTEAQGRRAYTTWLLVKEHGPMVSKDLLGRATWYRHQKILKHAGLSLADMNIRNIVPVVRTTIALDQPITSWDQLRRA